MPFERLSHLLRAGHACVRIVTDDENDAVALALEAAHAAKIKTVYTWGPLDGLRDATLERTASIADTTDPVAAMSYVAIRFTEPAMVVTLDLAEHLQDAKALRAWREAVENLRRLSGSMVMIDHRDSVPAVVEASAVRVHIPLPTDEQLDETVRATLRHANRQRKIEIDITRTQLGLIVANLRGLTRRQARQVIMEVIADDRRFDMQDLDGVLKAKRGLLQSSGLLEFVDSPTDMSQIGGLSALKKWLAAREKGFSEKAREFGISPPRGMLLLGVQGAGKSLCAKAVATAWQRPLLRLDPGVLYDRYVGESEKRLRGALRQAEAMSPIVLWIDEIEKAFASAASQSTDGGLSQRMFGTLLTWMQEHASPVFLVATANNIDALPPELLRKGRFDEIFFVDLPSDEARRQIFSIHLSRRKRDPKAFDLAALVAASDGYSGAEIEQAILSALHASFHASSELTTQGVLDALRGSPPLSVTMAERIAALREWAEGRCMQAE